MTLATLSVLMFGSAVLLAAFSVQGIVRERREVSRTLASIAVLDPVRPSQAADELAPNLVSRILVPGLLRLGELTGRLIPLSSVERIDRTLVYAGSPDGWDAERVLAIKLVAAAVLAPAAVVVSSGLAGPLRLLLVAVVGAAGYRLPEILLRSRARKRQELIRKALPNTLDLLAVTVEAGLGFDSALVRVARQASGPLAEELNRVLRETQLGRSRVESLRDLGERSDIPELKSFVLALVQADVFGVSTARVLQVQAAEIRVKRRQRAEEQAQKIPVKIVFPLVLCIMPALFVVLLGPAAVSIYRSLVGLQ